MPQPPLRIFIPHCSDVLSDHLPNGDSLVAFGFIKHLAERGHQLYIATERLSIHEHLPPNVHVEVLTPRFSTGPLRRLDYMARMRAHYQQVRQSTRFDLVHQLNPVFAGLSLALWDTDIPLVLGTYVAYWPEEPVEPKSPNAILRSLIRRARFSITHLQQQFASALLLTTPAARNRLADADEAESKVQWLGHGINSVFFSPFTESSSTPPLAHEQASRSILFLANLHERKGILTLLRAFAVVSAKLPDATLTIAGDGPLMPACRALAQQLGIAGRVQFLGSVPRSATPELYRTHAVYCLPSLGEPYATSILEAMSCGRAIVTSRSGGLPYMVPEGGGLHVAPGNVAELATALIQILTDPGLRARMGAINREKILRSHTWQAVTDRLEEIYNQVLSRKNPDST